MHKVLEFSDCWIHLDIVGCRLTIERLEDGPFGFSASTLHVGIPHYFRRKSECLASLTELTNSLLMARQIYDVWHEAAANQEMAYWVPSLQQLPIPPL